MIERIDGSMHRRGGAGERQERRDAAPAARSPEAGHDPADGTQRLDARLATLIADVERLCAEQDAADALPPADAHRIAERMAQDGSAALAAQAGLGPQGVRLVLGAPPADGTPREPAEPRQG